MAVWFFHFIAFNTDTFDGKFINGSKRSVIDSFEGIYPYANFNVIVWFGCIFENDDFIDIINCWSFPLIVLLLLESPFKLFVTTSGNEKLPEPKNLVWFQ